MNPLLRLIVLVAVSFSFAALNEAEETQKKRVQVEAVVQKYETAAMEDVFEDGRFAVYDAVTLKIVAPKEMENQTIRVHIPFGSIADKSPLRRPGRRFRFDFDTRLLKKDALFHGVLENLQSIKLGKP